MGGGKSTKGYKGMQAAKTDDADSVYTSQTVRGGNWGIVKDQRKWERETDQQKWGGLQ